MGALYRVVVVNVIYKYLYVNILSSHILTVSYKPILINFSAPKAYAPIAPIHYDYDDYGHGAQYEYVPQYSGHYGGGAGYNAHYDGHYGGHHGGHYGGHYWAAEA